MTEYDPSTGDPISGQPAVDPMAGMSPSDLLRVIGRELEKQTAALSQIRAWVTLMGFATLIMLLLMILVVTGVITVEFKPLTSRF